jgi:hypothetical protein
MPDLTRAGQVIADMAHDQGAPGGSPDFVWKQENDMRKTLLVAASALALTFPAQYGMASSTDTNLMLAQADDGNDNGAENGTDNDTGNDSGADNDTGDDDVSDSGEETDPPTDPEEPVTDAPAAEEDESDADDVPIGTVPATTIAPEDLIGVTVASADGDFLGAIEDVIAGADGWPQEVVVVVSDDIVASAGERRTLPAERLHVDEAEMAATAMMTRSEFEAIDQ